MAKDAATKWGIPHWTNGEEYPDHTSAMMTKAVWRWEFLRRRKEYRAAWDHWRLKAGVKASLWKAGDPYLFANTDDRGAVENFGVDRLYDPSQRFDHGRAFLLFSDPTGLMPEHDFAQDLFCGARLAELGKLDQEMELLEQDSADRREAGLVEYCFSLALPLEPQINKARRSLIKQQEELFGKVSTPRPSREMWSLYLRVLDARDCGASWSLIGETLWPKDDERCDLKHKARRTHEQAAQVRDNFPI